MAEKIINVDNSDQIQELLGNCDSNLNTIQKKYGVVIISRGNNIKIIGNDDKVNEAEQAIRALLEYAGKGENINEQAVRYVTNMVADGADHFTEVGPGSVLQGLINKIAKAKNKVIIIFLFIFIHLSHIFLIILYQLLICK